LCSAAWRRIRRARHRAEKGRTPGVFVASRFAGGELAPENLPPVAGAPRRGYSRGGCSRDPALIAYRRPIHARRGGSRGGARGVVVNPKKIIRNRDRAQLGGRVRSATATFPGATRNCGARRGGVPRLFRLERGLDECRRSLKFRALGDFPPAPSGSPGAEGARRGGTRTRRALLFWRPPNSRRRPRRTTSSSAEGERSRRVWWKDRAFWEVDGARPGAHQAVGVGSR